MKLSYNWLADFVDLSGLSPQEVADKLTMGAFEVEEIRKIGPDLKGPIVVGEILEVYAHPNANKIRLTKVQVKPGQEPLEIVCGAPNIQVGQKIPVALPGAQVVNRHDGTLLPIKTSVIRGVTSNGMLCSASELGVLDSIDGILILPDYLGQAASSFQLGSDVRDILALYPDWVLHVAPRSNRGDAQSVRGLAREVAALLKRPFKESTWSLDANLDEKSTGLFDVSVEDLSECPFFTVRVIEGLKVAPSPAFIKKRLEAVGVRSINNIVDITNYVMYEMGQPLHAYDLNKLASDHLRVRQAKVGESVVTIDGQKRQLTEEILVIADKNKPVGVAGIMGGGESEIDLDTCNIALEAACFKPARIRRGSRLLGLSSDSSLRFERGVDIAQVKNASDYATYLLLKYCSQPNTKVSHLCQAGQFSIEPRYVTVRLNQLTRLLAVHFSVEQVKELISPLGFTVTEPETKSIKEPSVLVSVPSFRQNDVTREIDVIEEICRLWGYDQLPVSLPQSSVKPHLPDHLWRLVREALSAQGLNEAWVSSLVGADELVHRTRGSSYGFWGMENPETLIRVLNPLSEDHQVLRQSLLPGLVKTAVYNQDQGNKDVWLFELGFVYEKKKDRYDDSNGKLDSTKVVKETPKVAAIIVGENNLSVWAQTDSPKKSNDSDNAGFYTMKGIVENLLAHLKIRLSDIRFLHSSLSLDCLHPKRNCQIELVAEQKAMKKSEKTTKQHSVLGWLGQLHPGIQDSIGLRQPAYMFELNLDKLKAFQEEPVFAEVSNTPLVMRDITIDVPESIDQAALKKHIEIAVPIYLQLIELVSIYSLDGGKKALSYRLGFRDSHRTLTSDDVEDMLIKVRNALISEVSASFRS